jgi:hypothetical protein
MALVIESDLTGDRIELGREYRGHRDVYRRIKVNRRKGVFSGIKFEPARLPHDNKVVVWRAPSRIRRRAGVREVFHGTEINGLQFRRFPFGFKHSVSIGGWQKRKPLQI